MSVARPSRAIVAASIAAVLIAACGSGATSAPPATQSVAPTAPPTAPASATTSASASPASACAASPTRTYRVAWVMVLANSYTQGMLTGAQAGAPGCNVQITKFDTGFDAQKQYADIEDIVAQHASFDGILVQANDAVGIVPAIKDAIAAGLQVVALNVPIGPSGTTIEPQVPGLAGSVLTTQVTWGQQLAQMTQQACQGLSPCKVAYIAGETGSTADDNILNSFKQGITAQSTINLVSVQGGGGFLAGPSEAVAKNILTAHPDINVILSSGDQMTQGAELAAESLGIANIKFIGLGASVIGVAAVKSGKWFGTVAILAGDIGGLGMQMLLRHIGNPSLPGEGIDPAVQLHLDPLLTQQNIDDFKAQWAG